MKKPIITKLITTLHLQYGDDLLPITITSMNIMNLIITLNTLNAVEITIIQW